MACADLSRGSDPTRTVHHVCLESRDGQVTIMATDGRVVFRFDFRAADFPAGHWIRSLTGAWSAPGSAFPRWGDRVWGISCQAGVLTLEALSKAGKPLRKQPPPLTLTPGAGPMLGVWSTIVTQEDPIEIDVSSGVLADCIELLEADSTVHMQSPDGDGVILTAGEAMYTRRWRAIVNMDTPPFALRFVNAGLLWQALDVCRPVHMVLSATDPCAPIIFRSPEHTAIVMPLTP